MISIGIHINDSGFFIVESSFQKNSLQIKDTHQVFFEPQSLKKEIDFIEYIKTLEKKYPNQSLHFCYHIPQSEVSTFNITLPFKEKFKILKTLPFEIEENSPFSSAKVCYDARVSHIGDKTSQVVCFITPESTVNHFLQSVKSIQTKPSLLSAEGAALANIVENWKTHQTDSQDNQLFIYMGFCETTILFFHQGKLENITSLDWDLQPIIKNISKKYKLSYEDAIEEFLQKSFVLSSNQGYSKEQSAFSDLIKVDLEHLIHKLNLLNLSYSDDSYVSLDECIVFGPGAAIQNLSAFLSAESSYKFSKFQPTNHLGSLDLNEPKNYSFLIPLGLSLEAFKRPPYTGINFLHSIYKKTSLPGLGKWKTWLALGFVGLIILFAFSFMKNYEVKFLSTQMDEVFFEYGKKIMFKGSDDMTIENAQKYIKSKNEIKKLESVIADELSQTSAISHLSNLTRAIQVQPSWNLEITFLDIQNNEISISGFIDSDFEETLLKKLRLSYGEHIQNMKLKSDSVANPNNTEAKKVEASQDENLKTTESDNAFQEAIENTESANNREPFLYRFKVKGSLR